MFDRVAWPQLYSHISQTWKQGQHFVVIAPTGRGKTVLIQELVKLRQSVVFFGTKVKDEEYDNLVKVSRYQRVNRWPPAPWLSRVMLWPRPAKTIRETTEIQKSVFREALDSLFRRGRWTIVFDELHWMSHDLGLGKEIATLHHQGRSAKLTLIDGFQRPAFVPRIVYSSATHLAIWGTNDPNDLKTLTSLTGIPIRQWLEVMESLGDYEFVYVNIRNRRVAPVISQVVR